MLRLWARTVKKNRIARSETVDMPGDLMEALGEVCALMDIPRPMWLAKHEREWDQFRQTAFTKDHFVESVPFDKLEIEQFDPDEKKKKSQDPRNG